MINITILGCGCAEGVPVIGCLCRVCKSKDKKNKRLRQSIYIESRTTKILIDAGPDLRAQALTNNIKRIDGVLITHAHADHIGGLDELRIFCARSKASINLFAHATCLSTIETRSGYLFNERKVGQDTYMRALKQHAIIPGKEYSVGDIKFIPFMQMHGNIESTGFLFEHFAYSTDVKHLDEKAVALLKGTPLWMVDCTGFKKGYPAHFGLREVIEVCKMIQPKKVLLIHMSHELDYKKVSVLLPKNIALAYDGMKISLR